MLPGDLGNMSNHNSPEALHGYHIPVTLQQSLQTPARAALQGAAAGSSCFFSRAEVAAGTEPQTPGDYCRLSACTVGLLLGHISQQLVQAEKGPLPERKHALCPYLLELYPILTGHKVAASAWGHIQPSLSERSFQCFW